MVISFGFCWWAFRFWATAVGPISGSRPSWRGEHHKRNVMPAMPGSALVVIEPELRFRGFKAILDRPSMAFDRYQRFSIDVPAGHQVVKKARSSSAIRRRIGRPRVHKPSFALLNCPASRSVIQDNANRQPRVAQFRLPLIGASSRTRRVWAISAAVPATGARLPPGSEHMRAADPKHVAFAFPT